ncbi:MAG: ribulose-phosphate 3-epimerase [Acholeplasmataceae bacterium]|nr:ribulose-phosphate 3-epimerase [Acholeplasmataceae bacterium]
MLIAPSVLTADFSNLKRELDSIKSADYLHLDIMDGHFVPNISFGSHISKMIGKATDLKLDVHLMVTDPLNWVDEFSFDGVEYITIHLEANDVDETLLKIKKNGKKVGLSIKPNTPIEKLIPYVGEIDLALIMTVEPGFGGQKFIDRQMVKVIELNQVRKDLKLNYMIEVDGGINLETIKICHLAGVDIAVAGSYLFNLENREKGIAELKKCDV